MADEYPWEVELVGDQLSLGSGGRYLNINVALGGQGWHFGERKSDSWVSLYSLADWQEHIQVADVQQAYQQGLSGTYALSFDLMPGGGQIHDCDHADGFVVARLDGRLVQLVPSSGGGLVHSSNVFEGGLWRLCMQDSSGPEVSMAWLPLPEASTEELVDAASLQEWLESYLAVTQFGPPQGLAMQGEDTAAVLESLAPTKLQLKDNGEGQFALAYNGRYLQLHRAVTGEVPLYTEMLFVYWVPWSHWPLFYESNESLFKGKGALDDTLNKLLKQLGLSGDSQSTVQKHATSLPMGSTLAPGGKLLGPMTMMGTLQAVMRSQGAHKNGLQLFLQEAEAMHTWPDNDALRQQWVEDGRSVQLVFCEDGVLALQEGGTELLRIASGLPVGSRMVVVVEENEEDDGMQYPFLVAEVQLEDGTWQRVSSGDGQSRWTAGYATIAPSSAYATADVAGMQEVPDVMHVAEEQELHMHAQMQQDTEAEQEVRQRGGFDKLKDFWENLKEKVGNMPAPPPLPPLTMSTEIETVPGGEHYASYTTSEMLVDLAAPLPEDEYVMVDLDPDDHLRVKLGIYNSGFKSRFPHSITPLGDAAGMPTFMLQVGAKALRVPGRLRGGCGGGGAARRQGRAPVVGGEERAGAGWSVVRGPAWWPCTDTMGRGWAPSTRTWKSSRGTR